MKKIGLYIATMAAVLLSSCGSGQYCIIEAESFRTGGGWVLCNQYLGQMGSPYIMAHGIGTPVEDAVDTVTLPEKGRYHVYVRTFNWTSPWSEKEGPGKFLIEADGTTLPNVLGSTGDKWEWQYAGVFDADCTCIEVRLKDLTGFDGRCDAVLFSRKKDVDCDALRNSLPKKPVKDGGNFDLVVCGGGIAGICAAVSAARLGVRTALIHDRSVLGGNNSSEIRVHLGGIINCPPYPNLGNLIREFGHSEFGNAMGQENYEDGKKTAIVDAEPCLTVFYDNHIVDVNKQGDIIKSVIAQNTRTGELAVYSAPLFADCTGDAVVGYLAGADYRVGRESRAETGEPSAVDTADIQVLGASVQWNTAEAEDDDFPAFEYGLEFTDESCYPLTKGDWTWETGMRRDQINEAERIRDYGMLVAYSNWSYLKNRYSGKKEFSGRKLNWVSHIAGKRESRRLMGDYILNENDIKAKTPYPDASVTSSWSIDLHYPNADNAANFPEDPFVAICKQDPIGFYAIPYRCFYSRNIDNLFMAGRNASVTHVALGTVRVMRTTGMMGEVVGMAASICSKHSSLPRQVYTEYLDELIALMKEGCGQKDAPDNQNFNLGH